MLPDPTGKNVFPFTVKTSTKADHNYCDSLRPMHDPFMLFAKPIVSVVLLLIQHYCCCVKPTVTDGNPAIIYRNSLCATKWKQLSQSTQRSVEQITTHNSLWVWEIYFLPDSLSLCNSWLLRSHSLSLSSSFTFVACLPCPPQTHVYAFWSSTLPSSFHSSVL